MPGSNFCLEMCIIRSKTISHLQGHQEAKDGCPAHNVRAFVQLESLKSRPYDRAFCKVQSVWVTHLQDVDYRVPGFTSAKYNMQVDSEACSSL